MLLLQLSKLLLQSLLAVFLGLCVSLAMIFPAEEEEKEEEEEEEEDEVSFRHVTYQSLREGRWTSQGGVRISSASRVTCPSQ